MTKKQRLEKIIIGTLLDNNNHYEACRCCVIQDMFSNPTLARIYGLIVQMRNEGAKLTDPYSIYERYGEQVADIVGEMCSLCQEYSFEFMKLRYNECKWFEHLIYCVPQVVTSVSFEYYVSEFLKEVMKDEKRRSVAAESPAA